MEEIRVEPLSEGTLESASRLVDTVFTREEFTPSLALRAYLHPQNYRDFWEQHQITHLAYWVALIRDRVVGITGLYGRQQDADEAFWISWFCIDPAFREQGIGGTLLRLVEDEARKRGKKVLRLYTSTDPSEAAAQVLYERRGYAITRVAERAIEQRIYREKRL